MGSGRRRATSASNMYAYMCRPQHPVLIVTQSMDEHEFYLHLASEALTLVVLQGRCRDIEAVVYRP